MLPIGTTPRGYKRANRSTSCTALRSSTASVGSAGPDDFRRRREFSKGTMSLGLAVPGSKQLGVLARESGPRLRGNSESGDSNSES